MITPLDVESLLLAWIVQQFERTRVLKNDENIEGGNENNSVKDNALKAKKKFENYLQSDKENSSSTRQKINILMLKD